MIYTPKKYDFGVNIHSPFTQKKPIFTNNYLTLCIQSTYILLHHEHFNSDCN